ncbi:MAG: DUF6508 domain-containing protein [Lachnospiraceae bacterium]|nr:DUF6508 domain-containing protein [Lachnospiraceae bacterium]
MEKDKLYMQEVADRYRPDVEKLAKYIPWLESKIGILTSSMYKGEGIEVNSVSFPVYDATLMSFVREAGQTGLMDRNYAYVYSRNRIRTVEAEQLLIERATIREMDMLRGILSKYVLGGRTKGRLWTEGVSNGSILKVVRKMKEVLEYWDRSVR